MLFIEAFLPLGEVICEYQYIQRTFFTSEVQFTWILQSNYYHSLDLESTFFFFFFHFILTPQLFKKVSIAQHNWLLGF